MSALRAQLFHVSRFSAIGLPMAETSGSSAGVMLVLLIPLPTVGFHWFFSGRAKGQQVAFRPQTEGGLEGFKGSFYC